MLRDKWTFEFSAKKLAEASAKKIDQHQKRLDFWKNGQESTMKEVRETGIEVSESVAGSNYTKSGYGPEVMVRTDLQKKLTECHSKIQEHTTKIREYKGWVEVLNGNPESRVQLHAEDYLFFFGE